MRFFSMEIVGVQHGIDYYVKHWKNKGFRLNWKNNRIYFGTHSKYDLYFKFNNAAKIIYENREQLQKIKQQALLDYRTTFLQRADCKEIEKIFESNARILLDKMSF